MGESVLQKAVRNHGPEAVFALLTAQQKNELRYEWAAWARPEQLPPAGNWTVWLAKSGRGSGKTRTGAEWVRSLAESNGKERIALVAPTAADARDVMVEGESGIMSVCPPWNRPTYEPSKRRITWPNGAMAITYSAEEADRLRGPQHSHAWGDELCSWEKGEDVWNMLMFGLRLGASPRTLVTTTPRPTDLIRSLIKSPGTVMVGGSTYDNAANLPAAFIEAVKAKYEGSRLGRQEIWAELLEDVEGALWSHKMFDDHRRAMPLAFKRIVVGVDPSGSAKRTADEAGIVVAGIADCACLGRADMHAFILEDLTGRYSPRDMGEKAIAAYHKWQATRCVIEDNFGGAMLGNLFDLIDKRVAYKTVHASRGKIIRAEPVAALFEQGKVHCVGMFKELEEECCQYAPLVSTESPGRLDAMVWAITDLMLGESSASFGDALFKSPGFTMDPGAPLEWGEFGK